MCAFRVAIYNDIHSMDFFQDSPIQSSNDSGF